MGIGDRIHDSINQWAAEWKDRLQGWLQGWINLKFTGEKLTDVDHELAVESLDPARFKTKEIKKLVEDMKKELSHSPKGLADWVQTIMGRFLDDIWDVLIGIVLPSQMPDFESAKASAVWITNLMADFVLLSAALDIVGCALSATLIRNLIHCIQLFVSTFGMDSYVKACIAPAFGSSIIPRLSQGYNQQYRTAIFDQNTVSRLWLRDKENYNKYWDDVKKAGVSDDRIAAIQELTNIIPQVNDLVMMAVKEAFSPEIAETFGQYQDYPSDIDPYLAKQGLSPEWGQRYWAAHWSLPSAGQGFELMHRGLISQDELNKLLKALDIMPFWRDKLTGLSWDLPNRIELRMMARYGLVDKPFLVEQLKKVGLGEEYRNIAADMMLVMGLQTDLSSRYSNAWINATELKAEIAKSGLDTKIQDRLYQGIVKNAAPQRVVKEKDLTVTDIIKGVKKNTISRAQGQILIMQLGYDEAEAKFKLDINIPVEEELSQVKQRELSKADIINAYKISQIDYAEAVSRLVSIRYKPDDADFILQLTDATAQPIEDVKVKSLTKADIIKGVKNSVISQEEGYYMLINIGYADEDANFILAISSTVPAGSPDTFNEFMAATQSYKVSQGLPAQIISFELIQAERNVKAAEAALKAAKIKQVKPERLQELELAVEKAGQAYTQLLAKNKAKT